MNVVIITGLSGSGKSSAAKYFEDMGYFCIDNLPPQLTNDILHVLTERENLQGSTASKLALVMDMRNPFLVEKLVPVIKEMQEEDINLSVLFLEASESTLLSRYNQSRRDHPLSYGRSLLEAIQLERKLMLPLRDLATYVLDTTSLSLSEMRYTLFNIFMEKADGSGIRLTVFLQSFGFKYGIPADCDNLIDVRFLPNPYYIDDLRELCGLDDAVKEYLDGMAETKKFLQLQKEFYNFVLPLYIREGKTRLHIGIGCTGGRHRSVHIAESMAKLFSAADYRVVIDHRDLNRDLYQ